SGVVGNGGCAVRSLVYYDLTCACDGCCGSAEVDHNGCSSSRTTDRMSTVSTVRTIDGCGSSCRCSKGASACGCSSSRTCCQCTRCECSSNSADSECNRSGWSANWRDRGVGYRGSAC